MEAHMMALASAEEGSESRRIIELAAEEEEANSVVFPGCVLQDENSVGESSSSSWQWPWAASREVNTGCFAILGRYVDTGAILGKQGVGDEIFVSRHRFARLGYFSAYSVVHFS